MGLSRSQTAEGGDAEAAASPGHSRRNYNCSRGSASRHKHKDMSDGREEAGLFYSGADLRTVFDQNISIFKKAC